jgi:hypothetical protein
MEGKEDFYKALWRSGIMSELAAMLVEVDLRFGLYHL